MFVIIAPALQFIIQFQRPKYHVRCNQTHDWSWQILTSSLEAGCRAMAPQVASCLMYHSCVRSRSRYSCYRAFEEKRKRGGTKKKKEEKKYSSLARPFRHIGYLGSEYPITTYAIDRSGYQTDGVTGPHSVGAVTKFETAPPSLLPFPRRSGPVRPVPI